MREARAEAVVVEPAKKRTSSVGLLAGRPIKANQH